MSAEDTHRVNFSCRHCGQRWLMHVNPGEYCPASADYSADTRFQPMTAEDQEAFEKYIAQWPLFSR